MKTLAEFKTEKRLLEEVISKIVMDFAKSNKEISITDINISIKKISSVQSEGIISIKTEVMFKI